MGRLEPVAVAYAAATAFGSWVAVRHDLRSEPFGRTTVRLPAARTVPRGLGGGTAIPWPMAVVAAVAAQRATTSTAWARTCTAVGATSLVGTLAEPATWGRRLPGLDVTASALLNVGASVLLIEHGRTTRTPAPPVDARRQTTGPPSMTPRARSTSSTSDPAAR